MLFTNTPSLVPEPGFYTQVNANGTLGSVGLALSKSNRAVRAPFPGVRERYTLARDPFLGPPDGAPRSPALVHAVLVRAVLGVLCAAVVSLDPVVKGRGAKAPTPRYATEDPRIASTRHTERVV